jgi:hypothetical protein
MAATSRVTIVAKVANAEKISTNPKVSAAALNTLITSTKTKNCETVSSTQGYAAAVNTRQKMFQKYSNSLIKVMPLIGATVRAAFGKTSKQANNIATMITKIRSVKVKKATKQLTAEQGSQAFKA